MSVGMARLASGSSNLLTFNTQNAGAFHPPLASSAEADWLAHGLHESRALTTRDYGSGLHPLPD